MALPPKKRAKTSPMAPSVWKPRPIPQPAPERRTADPKTPTQRELAERESQRTSLVAAPAPAVSAPSSHFPPGLPADLSAPGACDAAWGAFGREAQGVLQSGGPGDGDADPIARNRAISSAYAQFYERNPKLEWAGIASMVSSNAGCAMRAADAVIADANREAGELIDNRRYIAPDPMGGPGGGEFIMPAGRAYAAGVAREALADGNKAIFRDIFPALRMHERYGDGGLSRCATRPGRGVVDPAVRNSLSQAYSDDPDVRRAAGNQFARYEQTQVLEREVLGGWSPDRVQTRAVFWFNQKLARTETGRELGAQAPEVRLTSGCHDGTPAVPFDGSFLDPNRRVAYYTSRLVPAFERMNPVRRSAAIERLASGGAGTAP